MSADTFRVIPRIESGGSILLILPDFPANPGMLVCYARMGQHSECSVGYYRRKTTPAPHDLPAVKSLVREWCGLGNPCNARLTRRITK